MWRQVGINYKELLILWTEYIKHHSRMVVSRYAADLAVLVNVDLKPSNIILAWFIFALYIAAFLLINLFMHV